MDNNFNIEELFYKMDDSQFPHITNEDKTYKELYSDFSQRLVKYQNNIILGAIKDNSNIVLNDHGENHIKKVIEKVSTIYSFFQDKTLSAIELFFLLCSIRVHDIGNLYGRDNHETKINEIIKDNLDTEYSIIKKIIYKIANAHGGNVEGYKDKISYIDDIMPYHNCKIRLHLLAALLRFGDELADDYSRANYRAMKDNLLGESELYHEYSKSLIYVSLTQNERNKNIYIELYYNISYEVILKKFYINGSNKYFVDELKSRILKMEKERIYCMRYLQPYIFITNIKYEIRIDNENNLESIPIIISGSVGEKGYPNNINMDIIDIPSVDKIINNIKDRGWIKK